MMDARAFNADLRRKFAKTEAPIAPVPDMGFGQIHQPLGSFTQRRRSGLSIDRERARKFQRSFADEPILHTPSLKGSTAILAYGFGSRRAAECSTSG
jgi:hypothetical protein